MLLRFDVPARCADLLEGGLIDLGLIPAFEYARHDDYLVVPDVAIASRGAVDSVALFTRRDMADVRSIALDTSSRTSASLVRLLCAVHYRIEPEFRPAAPDLEAMLSASDAALVIGDPALFADAARRSGVQKIDLGDGLERDDRPAVRLGVLGRPRRCGAGRRVPPAAGDAAIAGWRPSTASPHARRRATVPRAARIARYLRESIAYDLDGPFLEGLRTFFALLAEHGLISRPALLRFFDAAA